VDIHRQYKPYPIPEPKQMPEEKTLHALLSPISGFQNRDHEPFVEIKVYANNTASNAILIPAAQKIFPATDEPRSQFNSMRQIAADNYYSYSDVSKIFYQQAQFMKDFEDNYSKQEPFFSYYPQYQAMGYEHLRTFFTWRTEVRKGNVNKTSVSYAFLYIYELINNIGVTGPQDGFDKLIAFWKAFRLFNLVIDRYVLQWIKDYFIYYPLPYSFKEFVTKHHLQMHYPTVLGYESDRHESFDLFSGISKYNIKKSIFYGVQAHEMLRDCFYFILNRLRVLCRNKNKCFEDFIFYPMNKETSWTPFSRALFYPAFKQTDRQVVFSEKEIYICHQNHWVYTTSILTEHGRQLIGYIMKEMESNLRETFKFKYKLKADLNLCDNKTLKKLEQMKISLPRVIKQCVAEFYALYTRKEVSVDLSNLMKIREEAQNIQEKLIIPEDSVAFENEIIRDEITSSLAGSDIWINFITELTQMEFEALTIILQNNDIKSFAREKGIMLEVLLDGINEKAADCIGDTLLCIEDKVSIYDDYIEKLTELLQ